MEQVTVEVVISERMGALGMGRFDSESDIEEILRSKDRVFVLFYEDWCPFCQGFLPVFDKFARGKRHKCARVMIGNREDLYQKYSIDVVPTVLLFEKGKVVKRLNGIHGAGLSEKQLLDFVKKC